MKGLKFPTLRIAFMFVVAVIAMSTLTALVVICVAWAVSGAGLSLYSAFKIYKCSMLVCPVGYILIFGAFLSRASVENKRINRTLATKGVTPRLIAYLKKKAEKASDPAAKNSVLITLASYLCEGEFYKECFEVLSLVKPQELIPERLDEYYNVYVYANLMMGDTNAAEEIYRQHEINFKRARLRKKNSPVLHTLAVLEYSRGRYAQAETLLMQSVYNSSDPKNYCDCYLFLGLCYLKTDRMEYAKRICERASRFVSTVYQRERLHKLMKLVEQAYAEAETEASAQ